MNQLKTTILLAALTALFLAIGQMVGGRSGLRKPASNALKCSPAKAWP